MHKYKVLLVFIIFFFLIIFSGCTNKYVPNSEWHLNSNSLFAEYGKKYLDEVDDILNDYDLEYTTEKEFKNLRKRGNRVYSAYIMNIIFSDGYVLEISIGEELAIINMFLVNKKVEEANIYDINSEYFEIMYKIAQFCMYDLHGSSSTFLELIESGKKDADDVYFSNTYNWYSSSEMQCEYHVSGYKNSKNEFSTVFIWLKGYLTDKNIYKK